MPVNEFILDSNMFPMLLLEFLECCVIIVGFLLFNAIYRDKKYFKRSLVALIIMILYQICTAELWCSIWSYLYDDYNRNFDLIVSYAAPFLFLGSMTTLYLAIKHNKKYFILYLYNGFFFITMVFLEVIPPIVNANNLEIIVMAVMYILFPFSYLIPLLLFFMHIKKDSENSLKENVS